MVEDWATELECNTHPFVFCKAECMAMISGLSPVMPRELPRDSGVYFVSDRAGEVVYVGQACDLKQRWSGHRFSREVRCGMFTLRYKVRDKMFKNALAEETFFIGALQPKYNSQTGY